jgi:tRNA(Arg) A34 adenosine deaminase TadA
MSVVLDLSSQLPKLTATADELEKMLACIESDIVPLTQQGVVLGNKVFGAAILDGSFRTTLAETNSEMESPLFHGEVHLISEWSKSTPPAERGTAAKASVFLSTHEPCCMCISSIVWTGFTKVFYLFSYELTSQQGIPHDINIMHELWGVPTYRKQNKFCTTACIMELVEELSDEEPKKIELQATIQRLLTTYDEMSKHYHTEKENNQENSLAFG